MSIYQLGDDVPRVPGSAYVADGTTVIGKVILGEHVSVWPGSNIQDNAVLHTDPGFPLTIGVNVTIGHQAMLHGCTIGNGTLIGIQAVIMNGAVIGKDCLIGACALVPEGKVFPDRRLIVGAPAKIIRELTDEDVEKMHRAAPGYVQRHEMYKVKLKRIT